MDKEPLTNQMPNEAGCSTVADKPESTPAQSYPAWPPAEPPSHGRGWPQETVPYPIGHANGILS